MIGQLRGKLIFKDALEIILDVGGVGYEIHTSTNTFCQLPAIGQEITLFTQLIIREDAHTLYGFSELSERQLFRDLIKVNGIGPKTAMAILSSINAETFFACISAQDIQTLTKVPGIGKKTAERLMVEMKDRALQWQKDYFKIDGQTSGSSPIASQDQAAKDAINALIALGYKPQEAITVISHQANKGLTSEELIRSALKNMVK